MFYLLHGEDEFTSREHLKKLRTQGDFGYNQDVFSGTEVATKTIVINSNTLPFLSEQRLIIVEGLPKKKRGEKASTITEDTTSSGKTKRKRSSKTTTGRAGFEKELAEHIETMPSSTVLIVIVDELLESSNLLLKAAEQHGKAIQSTLPKGAVLEKWINSRVKNIGARIAPDATSLLANFVGNNLRLLANEVDKLALYVGEEGTITIPDIRLLCAQAQEARIFDLTDALAQRNQKQALNILHDLLSDGEPPLKLISTITSQVRSLLLVKELAQKGMRTPQIASTLGMPPFVVDKAIRQVKNFKPVQLENTYRDLLATDAALKRSRLTPEMALDLLVVNFGQ